MLERNLFMKTTQKILTVNPDHPKQEMLEKAAGVVKNGGLIVFPTWCLYGIGADIFNQDAVEKVFTIKKRTPKKPLLILVKDRADVENYVVDIPEYASRLMNRFWPGKLTLVFHAKKCISDLLTAGTGKIGIRVSGNLCTQKLLSCLKTPITGTSANVSNLEGCSDINLLDSRIYDNVDLVLDTGRLTGEKGSTVVDVTRNPPVIVREGSVTADEIKDYLSE